MVIGGKGRLGQMAVVTGAGSGIGETSPASSFVTGSCLMVAGGITVGIE